MYVLIIYIAFLNFSCGFYFVQFDFDFDFDCDCDIVIIVPRPDVCSTTRVKGHLALSYFPINHLKSWRGCWRSERSILPPDL